MYTLYGSIIDHFCARYTPGPNVGRGGAPAYKTPRGLICVWARDPVCNGSVMRAGDYFPPPCAIIGRTGLLPGDKFASDSKAFSGKSLAPIALISLYLHYAWGDF